MSTDDEEPRPRSQLAQTIITLRSWNFWSHEALADRARRLLPPAEKLSAKTVGNIESDRHQVTVGKLTAIAAALGVEVWQLFLPPSRDSRLAREIILEISKRSPDDQRVILPMVRRLEVVEPPLPTERSKVSIPTPSVRRASGS